ncbi:MAG: NACHT domain-containing protein [Okeania sp. SIO3B3]|nr:NACHT domain-containing protein [Okeania sp. SIO3B3]
MPSEWVLQVVDKVSEYVAERVGLSLEDFAAVLRREKKVEDSGVVEEVGYFATVTAQVLRRLGGEYGKVAEELERNSKVDSQKYFSTQQLHPENTNPFTVGQPVLPEKFVGRTSEIDTAFERIKYRGHTAIYAPPGMGKTSLLKYLASSQAWKKQKLDLSKAVIVFLSCYSITPFTPSGFWVKVLTVMRDKLDGEPELQAEIEILLEERKNILEVKDIRYILRMLGEREKFLMLLVDDYDLALQSNDQYTETDMLTFLSGSRNLAVHSPEAQYITTVVTTLRGLDELGPRLPRGGSPWYNHYLYIDLKPFTETEVDKLLALGIPITSELKEAIQKLTGGHPALLQIAGYLLYKHLKVGEFSNYEELIVNFESETRELFQRTWYQYNEKQQIMLILIALSALKNHSRKKMPFDLSDINRTLAQKEKFELADLEERGVIVCEDKEKKQDYSFSLLAMEHWVIQEASSTDEVSIKNRKKFPNLMNRRQAEKLSQAIKWLRKHQEELPTFLEYTSSLAKLFSSVFKPSQIIDE